MKEKGDTGQMELPLEPGKRAMAEAAREAMRPDMVRIAPGAHSWVPRAGRTPPQYAVCRWTPDGGGGFAPVPVGGRYARVGRELLACLGFNTGKRSTRYETLYRLQRAGFIDMVRVSPGCWLLELDSWYAHLLRCMGEPEMWDEGSADLEKYRFANGLGGARAKRDAKE